MKGSKIGLAEVDHIARLARLKLDAGEKEIFASQLNHILEYVEKLNQLDTAGVSPTAHVLPMANVFREDLVGESLPREISLDAAPDQCHGYFRVPKIIE